MERKGVLRIVDVSRCMNFQKTVYDLRLDGGAAEDDSISSSGSRERLRRPPFIGPRFAADILGRNGELLSVRSTATYSVVSVQVALFGDVPHLYALNGCNRLWKAQRSKLRESSQHP